MTSPRPYGGGYYAAPASPDTPIYDRLVAERGTPQIAPIRVPSYDTGSYLPALPAPRPALPPAAQVHPHANGYGQQAAPQPAAPAPFIPQQASPPQWEQQRPRYGQPYPQTQSAPPAAHPGYEAMRPVAPRPAPAQPAHNYPDQYARPYYRDGQRY